MRIFGIDFTSAPRPAKPITCAVGWLEDGALSILRIERWISFTPFEAFLQQDGPWVCGMDFPFGQPLKLIRNLGGETAWERYVAQFAQMDKREFVALLDAYRAARPPGDKQHLRPTDRLAGAKSPMMVYGVPVGKMFYEGARRLLNSDVSVQPCRSTNSGKIALETYPALVARRWLSRVSYKNDTKAKQTAQRAHARNTLVSGLLSPTFGTTYGFSLHLTENLYQDLVDDPTGDALDAVCCAVQAAWGVQQPNYGIPPHCNPDEGWIVNPTQSHESA